ncbi:MAG: HlyD family type I secretion periplasmic adaptor subunit [Burkholderiaceae bacterium]|nr:MAG: HlyD family type I secretion periplasmic adaptor subunit [Burkholderiaceae bacterium]
MNRLRALLEKIAARLGPWAQRWMLWSRPTVDRLYERWMPPPQDDAADWIADAEAARVDQEPLRARLLLRWVGLIIALFLLWATFTRLDEVTRGEGKVIPSRQLQVIQSVDGGVITEIRVAEGQIVNAGDVLMKIDPTRFLSSLRENRAQYLSLLAKVTRLKAVSEGKPFIPPEEIKDEIPEIVAQELQLYNSTKAEMDAQQHIAQQQLSQRSQEMNEAVARRDQASNGLRLTSQELAVTRPLLQSGAVSEVEVLRLERDVSRYRGERDQAMAQISRAEAAISEARRKIQEVELNRQNQIRAELSDANAKLNAVSEGSTGLEDKVKNTDIPSPVRGTVKRILFNTVGGVVQPGKEVVEVVPLDDALLLEARVLPKDIGFLHPGQKAMVKFTAYDFSIYGGLDAVVEQISADSVVDEKGNAYYMIRVRTNKASLGENLPIIPGMVAEVDVLTGKKSVLSYLLKPVLRAKAHALTER